MRPRRRPTWSAFLVVVAVCTTTAAGCGREQAIVGGSCADGYTQCGQHCVDLSSDPANCGACGHACPAGVACLAGTCEVSGLADGAGPSDGAGGGDSSNSDADEFTGNDGSNADAADALPSDGAQGDAPSADATASEGGGGDGSGVMCDAGLVDCGGACVDTTSDPLNCGACGVVCPSQICQNSKCVGSTPGGIIFIGHDYAAAVAGTAQARVLSNAVFLSQETRLRMLSYERYADAAAVARVKNILSTSTPAGRSLTITSTATDSDVTALSFVDYSVLLIPDQPNVPGSVNFGTVGGQWASSLNAFTLAGGIVVVLDGGTGAAQMPALVTGTGLLSVTAQSVLPLGAQLDVLAPSDAVGVAVVSPYAAARSSVTITTEPSGSNVVYVVGRPTDAGVSLPVAVHKVL